jgi:hypothetical protein
MDQAFNLLRDLARAHTRRLSNLARAFVRISAPISPSRRMPPWMLA